MNTALALVVMTAGCSADLQAILDSIRIDQDVPGVSAVVTLRGEILFAGASGVADLETDLKMTPDTLLYAGSLSKILTAVLVLQLAERGELSLDDTVDDIASNSSAANDNVTISHLLTHSSGLDREGDFGYWFSANFPDEKALNHYLRNTDLHFRPGTAVRYSNIGYAALGAVIEEASGQSYGDALSRRVFAPLGMAASGALEPGPDIAAGYSPTNRVLPNAQKPYAGLGRKVGARRIREYHNAKSMTPAFGVFTTARDLSRLARFLLGYGGNDVLSEKMLAQMLTAQTGKRGLGIRIDSYKDRPVARHGGWFAAHQSHLLLELQSGVGVVVMSNSDSASPDKIAEALLDRVLDDK